MAPPYKGEDGSSGIPAPGSYGLWGDSGSSYGVVGTSGALTGVRGIGQVGVSGIGQTTGVLGNGDYGVIGVGRLQGVYGDANSSYGFGVLGRNFAGAGGTGILGWSGGSNTSAVEARSLGGWGAYGLFAHSGGLGSGVFAQHDTAGNWASLGSPAWAGYFKGDVKIEGVLYKTFGGFLIDHPEDPANKYLEHSFVESSERKNVYDGITELDKNGEAQVELPTWFALLNRDFRYQLTCLGKHAPVFISQQIEGNRFRIAGGKPGLKVSWQVTGIRQDPVAEANPLSAEREKPEAERGSYLHPEIYGQPEEKSLWRTHIKVPEPASVEVPPHLLEEQNGTTEPRP